MFGVGWCGVRVWAGVCVRGAVLVSGRPVERTDSRRDAADARRAQATRSRLKRVYRRCNVVLFQRVARQTVQCLRQQWQVRVLQPAFYGLKEAWRACLP